MKRKFLKFVSILILSSLVLSSCQSSKKTEIKVRTKDRVTDETEDTDEPETDMTEDTDGTRVVTLESNLYTDAEAPIVVDWENYQKSETKENVFERKSEDYMDRFVPSSDYGAVLPYQATYSTVSVVGYEDDSDYYAYQSYGLIDAQGRIICDPIFSEAYLSYDKLLIVAQGYGEDMKYGAILTDGSGYTGTKFDRVMRVYGQDYYYGYTSDKITVFDSNLNVYLERSFTLDINNIDDPSIVESMEEMHEEYGFEPDVNDMYISRIIDKSHFVADYWGYTFLVDLNTGKLTKTADYFNPDLGLGGDYGDYYLTDKDGNQISDNYYNIVYGSRLPIFGDTKGNYYGLDPEGNVIYEFLNCDYLDYILYDEYMLIKTDYDGWTLFDKDFNEIGTYEAEEQIYVYSWYYDDKLEDIYLLDDGNVINPLTGEILIEDVSEASSVYIGDECIVVFNSSKGYILSNGTIFSSYEYWDMTRDIVTGKEYMVKGDDYGVSIYDVAADETFEIWIGSYIDSYSISIADGNACFCSYYPNTTYVYDFTDVDEPQLLFRYYCTNPIGDD